MSERPKRGWLLTEGRHRKPAVDRANSCAKLGCLLYFERALDEKFLKTSKEQNEKKQQKTVVVDRSVLF